MKSSLDCRVISNSNSVPVLIGYWIHDQIAIESPNLHMESSNMRMLANTYTYTEKYILIIRKESIKCRPSC
jgi:hypothetical protein